MLVSFYRLACTALVSILASIFSEFRPYGIYNPIIPRPLIRDSVPPRSRRYTGSIDLLYFPVASI